DARRLRSNDVTNRRGLPASGRGRLKKRVQLQLRLGTINIGTMTGRSRELADALKSRRIDIACVQETKWTGTKARDIGEGYKLHYNGTKAQNGVGIVVSGKLRDSVVEVFRVSDRLMSLKIDAGSTTLRIISCYAPQTNCPDDEKDKFWESFETHLRSVGPDEYIAVGGDLNGHVGQERDGYQRVHGGHGFGPRNNDGCRALDCSVAHDLAVANTFFKKRPAHLITYSSGGRETQIDYWLIRRCHLSLVTNVKVIPSTNIGPQHRLLVMDLKLNIGQKQKPRTTKATRIKWWRLPDCKREFKATVNHIEMDLNQPAAAIWDSAVSHIHGVASSILGKTQPGKRFIDKQIWWWNDEVQRAIKEKKAMFKTWFKSRDANDYLQYKSLKSAAKRAVAQAKAVHYDRLYEELDTPAGANKVYRLAKARHQATQDIGQVKHIKDENNQILRDPPAILRRWSEYFSKICGDEFPHPPIPHTNPIHGPAPKITTAEVKASINKMKNGKAPGPDDVPAEAWKLLSDHGILILTTLFNQIIEEGAVPEAWLTSTTVPIWKGKGDVTECSNYRPIRLLCHAVKIFERVINARIRDIATITRNQCGFVQGCSTIDAIHAARLLLEKHREKNIPVHTAFLDLEKAFDKVPHDLIWHSLRTHGVPEVYVKWVKLLYHNARSTVRCPLGSSPPFAINVGVHQGSALSPLLFILCMDTVTADLQKPHPWTLLYADDVLLASETRYELQQQAQKWKERLDTNGMRLNLKKTEYMECGPQTTGTIQLAG
ncbi:hypothetical protein B4U79_01873, partial [Dinothrombium tinctorium]